MPAVAGVDVEQHIAPLLIGQFSERFRDFTYGLDLWVVHLILLAAH